MLGMKLWMLVFESQLADCSLRLPWNTRRYPPAELTITASQIPVSGASRFVVSRLLKFLVPWLHSQLLQVLERWSHVSVSLYHDWLRQPPLFRHLVCPFISVHSCMSWCPYQVYDIFHISLSVLQVFFFRNFATIFSSWDAGPSASCFNACLESKSILTAIAESVNFSDTDSRALSIVIISVWYGDP